jgi:hypothetical protein
VYPEFPDAPSQEPGVQAERAGLELKVIVNPLDGTGPGKRLLSNLFYGCGYNFYRRASELCADDKVIRGKLSELLRECRVHLSVLEAAFRRQHRPLPDRDYSFLGPQALVMAQALSIAQRDLQTMETAIHTATLPERDRLHQPHRGERDTLERLVALDGEVLLALVTLRDAVARLKDGPAAAARMGDLLRASDFGVPWSRREALLSGDSG